MNLKHIWLLLFGVVVLFLNSCNGNTTITYDELSNDAQIASFKLTGNHTTNLADVVSSKADSIAMIHLAGTNFAIDQLAGRIYNPDSLDFGTNLRKFASTINYTGSPSYLEVQNDSTYKWNKTDSIDYTKNNVYLTVYTQNNRTKKYKVDLLIHKIDPDSIVWHQATALPFAGVQKTVLMNDQFYSYSINAGAVVVSTSSSLGTLAWSQQSVSGLPSSIDLMSITTFKQTFFAISLSGDSYTSTNGLSWTKKTNGQIVSAIYGILPGLAADGSQDLLLLSVKNGTNYNFATTLDLATVSVRPELVPSAFPIKGFSSATNYSRDVKSNMLLVTAGKNIANEVLGTTSLINLTSTGLGITTSRTNPFFEGEGNSTFFYNNLLYALSGSLLYTSSSWGYTWAIAPDKELLNKDDYTSRSGQSAIVDQKNNIWIFGGISKTGTYLKDVWKGKLNLLQ